MDEKKISSRGVYYDLTISPYEYFTPYGDIFKFPSKKKLEIYSRDISKELTRLESILKRNEMMDFLPDEAIEMLIKVVYRSFYNKVVG